MRRRGALLLRNRTTVLVVLHDRPVRARAGRAAGGVDLLLHLVELGLRLLGELLGLVEEPHAATLARRTRARRRRVAPRPGAAARGAAVGARAARRRAAPDSLAA